MAVKIKSDRARIAQRVQNGTQAARAAVAVQQDPSLEDILAADQAARQAVLARA